MFLMKILHFAGIYGDIESLKVLRDKSKEIGDLELALCTGNLLSNVVIGQKAQEMHLSFQNVMDGLKLTRQVNPDEMTQILNKVKDDSNAPEQLRKSAETYLKHQEEFDKEATEKYLEIKEIFSEFPCPVLMIPGRSDPVQSLFVFKESHLNERELTQKNNDGIKFYGYGSNEIVAGSIPFLRRIPFSQERLYELMNKVCPNVALVNVLAYGVQDRNAQGKSTGNFGTLSYLLESSPDLMLCGDNGNIPSSGVKGNSVVVNPSQLGKRSERDNGGFYTKIDYDFALRKINLTHQNIDNPSYNQSSRYTLE